MPLLTFVIPVRHQENAKDWQALKARLSVTLASIANQSSDDWEGIVVANEGADLPPMPKGFRVLRVDFPPNPLHDRTGATDLAPYYDATRMDKGRRILSGMLAGDNSRYFMVVDDDDLVSKNLVAYVSRHEGANGWAISRGYVWTEGGKLLFQSDNFHMTCGSSHIIRSDLYELPRSLAEADDDWLKTRVGSHIRHVAILAENGVPLEHLPFNGAIYRVGHRGSVSRSKGMLRKHVITRQTVKSPGRLLQNVFRLRWLSGGIKREFFGA